MESLKNKSLATTAILRENVVHYQKSHWCRGPTFPFVFLWLGKYPLQQKLLKFLFMYFEVSIVGGHCDMMPRSFYKDHLLDQQVVLDRFSGIPLWDCLNWRLAPPRPRFYQGSCHQMTYNVGRGS